MAMLGPRHEAVAYGSQRTYRTPLHLNSAFGRLAELTRFLNWLTDQDIRGLTDLDGERAVSVTCTTGATCSTTTTWSWASAALRLRRAAAQVVVDLVNHRDLFTTDRVPENLRPWGGAAPSAVAEMPSGRAHNKTPPLDNTVLQPLLAAATYLTTSLGPHAVELAARLRETEPASRSRPQPVDPELSSLGPVQRITTLLNRYVQSGQPLPQPPDHIIDRRLARGTDPHDPLLTLNWDAIARQAGYWQMKPEWLTQLRPVGQDAAESVGIAKCWARNAATVNKANDDGRLPWTTPLDRVEAEALIGIVRTATIALIAAISGMRSSELMELQVGCRRPPEQLGPELTRYRLASKVIKGQALGGVADEWVVIEPVYQAVALLESLHCNPIEGQPLLGRFAFEVRYKWFRNWVNGPAGQRLGLAAIPQAPVNLRILRRTLALELAYRPGGVLASKIHLKHIAVATTEGYASRPGGAQAELLAEVNKHEADRNVELVWAQSSGTIGRVIESPAGFGARELTEFFAHIDGKLAATEATSPKVQRNNREVLNLLTKRADTLQTATANYCWKVHRPLPGALPQTGRHPRTPTGCWPACVTPLAALLHPPPLPPTYLGRARPAGQDFPRRTRADPQDRENASTSRPPQGPACPRRHRQRHHRNRQGVTVRITASQRQANENRIRAVIDRLLRGEIPADGGCDVKTLALQAGVDRTAFYGKRPYAQLRVEFEQRLAALQQTSDH